MVAVMRLSIWPGAGQPYEAILEAATHAEETGWDAVYIADHFMPNAGPGVDIRHPVLEATALVAALGAAVPRVRIGTLVLGNTYRHPAVVANLAATLDRITGGRFVLGVGAGWQVNEHEQYGIDLPPTKQLLDRFVEALQVLRGLLRDPVTSFDGTYYQLAEAVNEPKPVQEPLPILIGAKGEKRMLGVVAQYADLWNAWGTPDLIAHKMKVLDEHCARIGRDPSEIDRTAQALTVVDGSRPDIDRPVIGGSRADLAASIEQYEAIGLDELIVPDAMLGTGADRLRAMDTIRSLVR
jgi:alkanesulfonate monooxygenase SsuD/methylene tetrahydromethanopterin reductase-like flavin-dependent oxidoreductase (luciferase family)